MFVVPLGSYLFDMPIFCICLLKVSLSYLTYKLPGRKSAYEGWVTTIHPEETEARLGLVACIHMHTHIHTHTQLNHKARGVVWSLTNAPQTNWSQIKMLLTCEIQNKACQECKVTYGRRWKKLLQLKPHLTLSSYWSSYLVPKERPQSSWDDQWPKRLTSLWVPSWPHPSATLLFHMGHFQLELRYYQCEIPLQVHCW